MKHFFLLVAFVAMVFSAQAQTNLVGHRTFTFTDAARANRSIAGHIYYPATAAGDNKTFAAGKFPVVVFGHGFTITYTEYDFWWTTLVQNGYVVVIPTTEGSLSPSHANFGNDLKFLVAKMNSENALSTSPYFGKLTGKSAVMGHSMGGGAAFLAATNNTAVNALVTFAAAETNPSAIAAAAGVKCPTLTLGGSRDCVAAPATNAKAMHSAITTPYRAYIEIKNGSHCQFGKGSAFSRCILAEGTACGATASGFITNASQHTQMNSSVLPFLDYTLRGNCAGWTAFRTYLTSSTLHTYLQAGTGGAGCPLARTMAPNNGTETVATNSEKTQFAYPNPSNGELNIEFFATAETQNASITIMDMMGRAVLTQNVVAAEGTNLQTIDISALPQGTYLIRTAAGNDFYTTKIAKQ
jgi:predicted dienelactone hydrolase